MLNVLVIVHIVVAVLLVVLVLLQDSKGGAMGGMMGGGSGGGGSNSLFGPTGATSLAAKATRYMAVIFAATSIALTSYTTSGGGSVVDDVALPVPAAAGDQDLLPLEEKVDADAPALEETDAPAVEQEPAVDAGTEEPLEE